ncbi:hypothetical protein NU219Hw_g4896t1 [Hortaea werneckii]
MSQDNVLSLVEALQECFETGEYADMTITCGDKIWRVHKVVVCSQVPFFAKAVTGRFKVRHLRKKHLVPLLSLHQEAVDSCIDLVDDDPSAVEVMLRWLYYGTFQVDESKPLSMSTILFLARSYTIADKYLLADLRTTVGQKLRAALMHRDWDVEDLLALIEELFAGADGLSSAAPELLRTWVISAAHANYTFCYHSSPSHMRFREVTSSRPDFLSGALSGMDQVLPQTYQVVPEIYQILSAIYQVILPNIDQVHSGNIKSPWVLRGPKRQLWNAHMGYERTVRRRAAMDSAGRRYTTSNKACKEERGFCVIPTQSRN